MFVGWHLTNLGQPVPQIDNNWPQNAKNAFSMNRVLTTCFYSAPTFRQMRLFPQCLVAVKMHVANGQSETRQTSQNLWNNVWKPQGLTGRMCTSFGALHTVRTTISPWSWTTQAVSTVLIYLPVAATHLNQKRNNVFKTWHWNLVQMHCTEITQTSETFAESSESHWLIKNTLFRRIGDNGKSCNPVKPVQQPAHRSSKGRNPICASIAIHAISKKGLYLSSRFLPRWKKVHWRY